MKKRAVTSYPLGAREHNVQVLSGHFDDGRARYWLGEATIDPDGRVHLQFWRWGSYGPVIHIYMDREDLRQLAKWEKQCPTPL